MLIPWDKKNDYLGHSDGMVRFIDDSKVLLQGYFDSYSEVFQNKLYEALEGNKIDWVKLDFNVESEDPRNWAYINFLQTKEIMIVPKFGIPEDSQALNTIRQLFPEYSDRNRIFQVDVANIVKKGGGLNCITWTIKK